MANRLKDIFELDNQGRITRSRSKFTSDPVKESSEKIQTQKARKTDCESNNIVKNVPKNSTRKSKAKENLIFELIV